MSAKTLAPEKAQAWEMLMEQEWAEDSGQETEMESAAVWEQTSERVSVQRSYKIHVRTCRCHNRETARTPHQHHTAGTRRAQDRHSPRLSRSHPSRCRCMKQE